MSDHTRPRPLWALRSLELLQQRLDAAMSSMAFHRSLGHMTQAYESEMDAADYRRQIAEWKQRYGLGDDATTG